MSATNTTRDLSLFLKFMIALSISSCGNLYHMNLSVSFSSVMELQKRLGSCVYVAGGFSNNSDW